MLIAWALFLIIGVRGRSLNLTMHAAGFFGGIMIAKGFKVKLALGLFVLILFFVFIGFLVGATGVTGILAVIPEIIKTITEELLIDLIIGLIAGALI